MPWLTPWGPIRLYRHTVSGVTVMAASCSPFAGCSKAHPSSVSQSKLALPDTPRLQAAAVGLSPQGRVLLRCWGGQSSDLSALPFVT